MISEKNKIFNEKILLLSVICFLGINLNLKLFTTEALDWTTKFSTNVFGSFSGSELINSLLLPILYFSFIYISKTCGKSFKIKWIPGILSFVFSFFMLFGKSFEETDSYNLVFPLEYIPGQMLKVLLYFAGYFILFIFLINYLYYFMDCLFSSNTTMNSVSPSKFWAFIEKHSFLVSFLLLLLINIPLLIYFYPGLSMGDTPAQIRQAYPDLRDSGLHYLSEDRLLSNEVFLNQHHPIVHTLLLHMFSQIGLNNYNSPSSGLFGYVLLQFIFINFAIALTISTLAKRHILNGKGCILSVLYMFYCELVNRYQFVITKDIFFGGFFLLTMIALIPLIEGTMKKRNYIYLLLTSLGMILFRSEGKYLLLATFLFIAIFVKKSRISSIIYIAFIICFSYLFNDVLLISLNVTPASKYEMYSIPLQQTARYIKYYEDELTKEEKKILLQFFDVEDLSELGEAYEPNKSDGIKGKINFYAEEGVFDEYLRIWYQMFKKHPGMYIQATMNNYYMYVYPGKSEFWLYYIGYSKKINKTLNKIYSQLSEYANIDEYEEIIHPNYDQAVIYETARYKSRNIPLLALLYKPAFYTWSLMLLAFYCIRKKVHILNMLLPILSTLVCFTGPCNGYYARYQYSVALALPFVLAIQIYLIKMKAHTPNECNDIESNSESDNVIQESSDNNSKEAE